jgi:aspartate aminotransferase
MLKNGDKVLMTIPTFGPFYQTFHKRRLDIKSERLSEETSWKLTPETLNKMLEESPDAKLLLFTHPGNPMGEVYSKAELIALSEVIINHNQGRESKDKLIVFSDEVARNTILNKKEEFCSIGSLPGMEDCTITGWSLSKDQSPGLGVAIAIGSKELVSQMNLGEGPAFPMQMAVVPVFSLEHEETFEKKYEEANEIYRNNLRLATSRIAEINESINEKLFPNEEPRSMISAEIAPEGGFQFTFNAKGLLGAKLPDDYTHITDSTQKHIMSSVDLAYYLRDVSGVELIPGEGFGFEPEEMKFRMTISKKEQQLTKSFDLISKALSALTLDKNVDIPTPSISSIIFSQSSNQSHLLDR